MNCWPYMRARFLLREVVERGFDLPLASVTKEGGVEFRSDLDISVWNPGDDTSLYKRVLPGDFVIGLRSFQSGIGYSTISGLVSPAYTVLRPRGVMAGGYYRYYFKSSELISRLENVAQGIRQGRTISTEDFYNLRIPAPPIGIQRAIASFLDAETARIDALIEKRQRLAELLEERLISYTSDIVSRGPVVKVKHLTSLITSGPRGWADYVADEGRPFIRSANLQRGSIEITLENLAYVAAPSSAEAQRSSVRAGDVVVGITGANTGWVGLVSHTLAGGFVSQHVAVLRPSGAATSEWLANSLAANQAQEQLLGGQYGGTKQQLGLEDLANLQVHVPPLSEQRDRGRQLSQYRRWNAVIRETLAQHTGLIQERRQALITAAVTGDLDVPGAAA